MKKLCWIAIILMFLFNATACTMQITVPQNMSTTPNDTPNIPNKTIAIYEVDREVYYRFVKTPTMALLDEFRSSYMTVSRASQEGYLDCVYIDGDSSQASQQQEGFYGLPDLPIYAALVDFSVNGETLQAYLSAAEIPGTLTSSVIVGTAKLPTVIWVKTTQSEVLIAVSQAEETDGRYNYQTYSPAEFYDTVKPDEGTLFVNGQECAIVVHTDYAEIPFLFVVRALGGEVTWDTENTAVITLNGERYVLDTAAWCFTKEQESMNFLLIPPGGRAYRRVVEGDVLFDHVTARCALEPLGATLLWDRETGMISVDFGEYYLRHRL